MSSKLEVKYFKNGDRYYVGLNRRRIGSRPWTIDWHHDLWPWMTLNCAGSGTLKLYVVC